MKNSKRRDIPRAARSGSKSEETTPAWIDVSVPITSGMVHWPDNPPVRIERIQDLSRGDAANVSKLEMGAHTGTHMDAPRHFLAKGAGLDEMPLDATIGPARVIRIAHPGAILPAELEGHRLQAGERVLFRTRNSGRCWKSSRFVEDFVYISAAAARLLVERRVRTVGIDYLSVGGYVHDGVETHQILLGAGIWLIEGLNLAAVKPGEYELVCLPLRVAGADGAPARAILRPRRREAHGREGGPPAIPVTLNHSTRPSNAPPPGQRRSFPKGQFSPGTGSGRLLPDALRQGVQEGRGWGKVLRGCRIGARSGADRRCDAAAMRRYLHSKEELR